MRTTIDLPDALARQVRTLSVTRKTTLRALVIESLQLLTKRPRSEFKLRSAAFPGHAGFAPGAGVEDIAKTIRSMNEGRPLP